jgi:hypothetical protein
MGSQGNKARTDVSRERPAVPGTAAMLPGGNAGLRPVASSIPHAGAPPQRSQAAAKVNGRGGMFGEP